MGQLDVWARGQGYKKVAGVDEVGRGPLAGPVVAAAVVLPRDHGIVGLMDSKKLTPRRREELAKKIYNRADGWGLGVVGPERIDEINIRRASLEAMAIAYGQLLKTGVVPDLVLVDGLDVFSVHPSYPPVEQRAVIKADVHSEVVSAASIIAKVYRDSQMKDYHTRWPQYGFDRHKGYPTVDHRRAIEVYGPCQIHRRSFHGAESSSSHKTGAASPEELVNDRPRTHS